MLDNIRVDKAGNWSDTYWWIHKNISRDSRKTKRSENSCEKDSKVIGRVNAKIYRTMSDEDSAK